MPGHLCILDVPCQKLEPTGMPQSRLKKVVCSSYVDGLIFWSKNVACIHELASAGFLGVRIKQNESGLPEMKEEGLIDHVIEALGLNACTVNQKATPAEAKSLVKVRDKEDAHGDFNHSSIVDMLLCLNGNS